MAQRFFYTRLGKHDIPQPHILRRKRGRVMDRFRFSCSQIPDYDCCSSCHHEWEDGYGEPIEEELGKRFIFTRCCGRKFKEWDRKDMLNILKRYRAEKKRIATTGGR